MLNGAVKGQRLRLDLLRQLLKVSSDNKLSNEIFSAIKVIKEKL